MSAHECGEVVEHVIDLAGELQCRVDLRWIEHGYGHYLTHAASGGTVDWRDQVKFHMMNTLTYFDHTPQGRAELAESEQGASRAKEIAIALEIAAMPGLTRDERLDRWQERTRTELKPTGLSRPTYYRRLLEAGRRSQA